MPTELVTDWEMWKRFDKSTFVQGNQDHFYPLAIGSIRATLRIKGSAENKLKRIEMVLEALEKAEDEYLESLEREI